jgi:hypothetical protein
MSTHPVTCPYCNALVTVAPGTTRGQRLPCARCGESFTLTSEPATTDISDQPAAPELDVEPGSPAKHWLLKKPDSANRRTLLILLGVMAFMAVGALAYALHTQQFRRDNDKGIVKENPKRRPPLDDTFSPDEVPTPPAKLAGLAWLPRDTTVVVGVHVRELLSNAAGKSLVTEPIDVGGVKVRIETLADWTGFKRDEIDHLVVGVNAEKTVPLPLLIVRLRLDVSEGELQQRLAARQGGTAGDRPVYEFQPHNAQPPLSPLYVCLVDKRTAVYAMLPNHLGVVPTTPRTHRPDGLGNAFERLGSVGQLWIVGHSDNWNKTQVPLLFKPFLDKMTDADRRRLLKVSTFAAWVQVDEPTLVEAALDCGDDQIARELQKYLDIPDIGVDPDWKASVRDGWLSLQIRAGLKKVRDALGR